MKMLVHPRLLISPWYSNKINMQYMYPYLQRLWKPNDRMLNFQNLRLKRISLNYILESATEIISRQTVVKCRLDWWKRIHVCAWSNCKYLWNQVGEICFFFKFITCIYISKFSLKYNPKWFTVFETDM